MLGRVGAKIKAALAKIVSPMITAVGEAGKVWKPYREARGGMYLGRVTRSGISSPKSLVDNTGRTPSDGDRENAETPGEPQITAKEDESEFVSRILTCDRRLWMLYYNITFGPMRPIPTIDPPVSRGCRLWR